MGGGIPAPGNKRNKNGLILNQYKNLKDYLDLMESMTKSKLVDIMLMLESNCMVLHLTLLQVPSELRKACAYPAPPHRPAARQGYC